jgi:hypothetical protein
MKPRFEEREGQLFRMLEEPVPLTIDAKLPCLVRLIQDDSRMGMFNRDTKPNRLSDFYLAARIVNNNIIVDEFMESDYHRFEIIGYPVIEGSHWWALYQMMQGLKVCNPQLAKSKAARLGCDDEIFNTYWYVVGDTVVEGKGDYGTLSVSSWIAASSSTGWQLYKEPKIEPPKEPDYVICKRCGGSKSIANPAVSNTSYTTCPKCGGTGYEIREPNKEQFEVGDWVEFIDVGGRKSQGKYLTNTQGNAIIVLGITCNMRVVVPMTEITHKLSSSEVILDFGSGIKGWIRRASNHTIEVYSKANCWLANIRYDMLDTETRKLVESLLKAQEEEE